MAIQTFWWEKDKAPWWGSLFENAILTSNDKEEYRIQALREQFLNRPAPGFLGEVSIDRAILVTESYKETEEHPPVLRRAKATKKILKNIPIKIYPHELIVGLTSTSQRGINVCPEFHTHFLEREIDLDGEKLTELDAIAKRKECTYIVHEEDKKRLREEIFPYWRGKNTYTYCMDELKRHYPHIHEAELYGQVWDFIYRCESPANVILDHATVLNKGLIGIKAEIDEQISKLDCANQRDIERRIMYEAMKISADAIVTYANRYAEEAERLAGNEPDPSRKKELLQIAKVCRRVPLHPASSWWEAVQSFWFVHSVPKLIEHGSSYSVGRLDQFMYPFLEKDLKSDKITKKKAQELLECLWLKFCQVRFLYDYIDSKVFADFYDDNNLTIGGVDSHGYDATNDLTYMILEAEAHVHLPEPNLELRLHKNSPEKLILNALEVLRLGTGKPQIVNDDIIIPSLMSRGVSLKEARNYASVGCQENTTDPNMTPDGDTWARTNAGWYNLAKPVEYALYSGLNPIYNKQIGPKTPDPSTFRSIDDMIDAVQRQDDYFAKLNADMNNIYDYILSREYPSPVVNLLLPSPRKSGIGRAAGGCKYNWTAPIGVGLANGGDIISAIEYIVFDKKIASMKTLLEALKKNWKGYEKLREQCRNAPKYGNDDDYADRFTRKRADIFMDAVEKNRCARGGPFCAGFFSVSAYVPMGWNVGATPDGRYASEPLADTIAPINGVDIKGPTATHKSAAKLDTMRITDGVIFNHRFSLGAVSTKADLYKWAALLRTYFDMGGLEVSYMVSNKETLLDAQQNPEKYPGLIVRVAGYSAFFVELSKEVQDTIINRTEHTW